MIKNAFWNYTEPVTFEVVNVKLGPVALPVTHWQNSVIGTTRQAVKITTTDGYIFYIDNEDGSGLWKLGFGGGPDNSHRDVYVDEATEITPVLTGEEWNEYSPEKQRAFSDYVDDWMRENYPETFARLQSLRESSSKNREDNPQAFKAAEIGYTSCRNIPAPVSVPCGFPEQSSYSKKKLKKLAAQARKDGNIKKHS